MPREFSVNPSYSCPGCSALIQARDERWRGWVRCPRCGTPALPPDRVPAPQPAEPAARLSAAPENGPVILIEGAPTASDSLVRKALTPPVPEPRSTAALLIVSTGLFVSAFLLLNAYLDRSVQSMSLFGTLAVVFLIVLVRLRMVRSRREAGWKR